MAKFKVAFEVWKYPADERVFRSGAVVEKQQTILELDDADLAGPELAEAMKLSLRRLESGSNDDEANQKEVEAAKRVREICLAAGGIISRFIEKELRGWARNEAET